MCDRCGGGPEVELSRRGFIGRLPGAAATTLGAAALLRSELAPDLLLAARRRRKILCKKAWGGVPPRDGLRRHTIRRLTIHHSGLKLTDNRDAPGRFRSYQRDHMSLGWPDIAYHVLIDRHGNIYKGRPTWARGDTRTSYDTTGHFLVMCEGNMSEQDISVRQLAALSDVLAWASTRFGAPPRTIHGHRDYAQSDCPGSNLYRRIENGGMATRVKRRLSQGGVDLDRLCGDAGRERVRAIENGTD